MAEEPRTDDDGMTPAQMREHIEEARLPGDGKRPHEDGVSDEAYDLAGRSLAHAFLVLCEEDRSLLDVEGDAYERASNEKLWQAFKDRWPDGDNWIGGTTGFMFGWAHNAVRYVLEAEQVGNPAIVTTDKSPEELQAVLGEFGDTTTDPDEIRRWLEERGAK